MSFVHSNVVVTYWGRAFPLFPPPGVRCRYAVAGCCVADDVVVQTESCSAMISVVVVPKLDIAEPQTHADLPYTHLFCFVVTYSKLYVLPFPKLMSNVYTAYGRTVVRSYWYLF